MRVLPLALSLVLAASVAAAPAVPGGADGPSTEGVGSPNMSHVANLQWDGTRRADAGRTVDTQGGTDVEFLTIDGRDYAFAGTYNNGLQVVDVTDPAAPTLVATYDCEILQGDVQAFGRDGRWFVTYTADDGYSHTATQCHDDARVEIGNGTFIIEVTDPTAPEAVAFLDIPGGSHNQTVHPSGLWMYNSSSDAGGRIAIISLARIDRPEIVGYLPTGVEDAHDITFSADGTRAYAATTDATVIFDTTDVANPTLISTIDDPAIYLDHQADPVTVGDRTFVIINDELAGAGGNEFCPGGGLHVWDVTDETAPTKVGAWFAPEVTVREGAGTGLEGTVTCTSHVFRIYPEQQKLVIAWFGAGIRVIDLSELGATPPANAGVAGASLPMGMEEVGYYRFPADSDAWSAKVFRFEDDGSAFIFADDQTRGFDVFRYDAGAPQAADPGTWLTPDQALGRAMNLRASGFVPRLTPVCDLSAI